MFKARLMLVLSAAMLSASCSATSRSAFTVSGGNTELLARSLAQQHSWGQPDDVGGNRLLLRAPHESWATVSWSGNTITIEAPPDDVEVLVLTLAKLACGTGAELSVVPRVPRP